ncbi:MAG: HEPN domain-containing protein [bacterium]
MFIKLQQKAEESLKVSQECIELQAYNTGISRAYYSIFQIIKSTCEIKSCDVSLFNRGERSYPHAEIGNIFCYLMSKQGGTNLSDMHILVSEIEKIYMRRKNSDYECTLYEKKHLLDAIRIAVAVKDWIRKIP